MRHGEILAIPATEDVRRQHLLVAAERWIFRDFVGPDVDQLDDPVRIAAARRGEEPGDRLPRDAQRGRERFGLVDEHVGARGGVALVVHQPFAPGGIRGVVRERRALAIGHRFRGVGDVFTEGLRRGLRPVEAEPAARQQVQFARPCAAALGAGSRPAIVALPGIGAGLIGQHARGVGPWAALQVMVEERLHHVAAEPPGGVAVEADGAEAAALARQP